MAHEKERPSLKIVQRYATTPANVWKAWTSAAALKQWMGPGETQVLEAAVDLRVGGHYRILMQSPDGGQHDVSGTYREIVPGQRIVFSWAWKSMPENESLVTIELRPLDTGTELTLTHEGFADEAARDHHRQGWDGCLAKLARHVTAT